MQPKRFNPKKHQEHRRKNRPIVTILPPWTHVSQSRADATQRAIQKAQEAV